MPFGGKAAPEWFRTHDIKWHDGQDGKPSNHMCDSQVCRVNFLFPFADRSEPLASLLRPLFPDLGRFRLTFLLCVDSAIRANASKKPRMMAIVEPTGTDFGVQGLTPLSRGPA